MLKKTSDYTIPAETVRIVRKAFPKGNLYIRLRDELGSIFQGEQFSELYSSTGQPGWPAWRLALVTIMQFMTSLQKADLSTTDTTEIAETKSNFIFR